MFGCLFAAMLLGALVIGGAVAFWVNGGEEVVRERFPELSERLP